MALDRKENADRCRLAVDLIGGQTRCKQNCLVCHHEPGDEAYLCESSTTLFLRRILKTR